MVGAMEDRGQTIDTPAHAILIALFIGAELFKFPPGKKTPPKSETYSRAKEYHRTGQCKAFRYRLGSAFLVRISERCSGGCGFRFRTGGFFSNLNLKLRLCGYSASNRYLPKVFVLKYYVANGHPSSLELEISGKLFTSVSQILA